MQCRTCTNCRPKRCEHCEPEVQTHQYIHLATPYNGFPNMQPCPNCKSNAVSFQMWKYHHLSSHRLRMAAWFKHVQTEQRSEQIGPKPKRFRAYHLQLQATETLSHTHGTTSVCFKRRSSESLKKFLVCSLLTSAKGRMKIVCAKCRYKIRKALLKFDISNDHRGNSKIHMFFMFKPLGTKQEIHGWQPKTR